MEPAAEMEAARGMTVTPSFSVLRAIRLGVVPVHKTERVDAGCDRVIAWVAKAIVVVAIRQLAGMPGTTALTLNEDITVAAIAGIGNRLSVTDIWSPNPATGTLPGDVAGLGDNSIEETDLTKVRLLHQWREDRRKTRRASFIA